MNLLNLSLYGTSQKGKKDSETAHSETACVLSIRIPAAARVKTLSLDYRITISLCGTQVGCLELSIPKGR